MMASQEDINVLLLMVGPELLTLDQLGQLLDKNEGNFLEAAAEVWEIRAGRYHTMVNITESGSSREMGKLYENALNMAKYYRTRIADNEQEAEQPPAVLTSGTRAIERP
jgi:hypothetical protein